MTSKFSERGILNNVKTYNDDSKLIKEDLYLYNYNLPTQKQVPAYKTLNSSYDGTNHNYKIGKYYFISKPYTLDKVTSTIYDPSDPGNENKKVVNTTDYSYVPVNSADGSVAMDLLPRKIIQTRPNDDKLVVENKYVNDYTSIYDPAAPMFTQSEIISLQNSHRYNIVVETINYLERNENGTIKKYLLNGNLNTFKILPSSKIYLWEKKKLKPGLLPTFTDFPWSKVVNNGFSYQTSLYKNVYSIDNYDNFGNPILVTGKDGIPISYTWSNNNTLLESQASNPTAGLFGALSHKKNFSYKPLIGVSTITDENGFNTNYFYDGFNRLKFIKGVDSKILQRYRYHYKDEPEHLTASIKVRKVEEQDGLFTKTHWYFSSANDEGIDGITYTWDFGDGSVQTTTSNVEVAHDFSTSSIFYTITLTKSHPTYGSVKATHTIQTIVRR